MMDAYQAAREALSEFRQQDDYLLAHGASPLSYPAPYEERSAAWDEWRKEHAPCILAMLHGFEAVIDRDDEHAA